MANWGIKASKSGSDVFTAEDDDLVLTSRYPLLKIYMSGSGTLSFSTSDNLKEAEITHNLGYSPLYRVRSEYFTGLPIAKDGTYTTEADYNAPVGAFMWTRVNASVDSTKLYISVYTQIAPSVATDIDYFYIIYIDEF